MPPRERPDPSASEIVLVLVSGARGLEVRVAAARAGSGLLAVLLTVAAVIACGDAPEGGTPGDRTPPGTAGSDTALPRAAAGGGTAGEAPPALVRLWFERGGVPVAVPRRVESRSLDRALEALVAGPRPEERTAGTTSWFSGETADVVRDVRVEPSGLAIVDFRDLPERIPGAGSSAGSAALLASLDSTVFQFDAVDSVEYRLEGSCDAFWAWLQRECRVVRRD